MNQEELNTILTDHKKWLNNSGRKRANLSEADLRWADLRWADLRWANLTGADLSEADLRWANLTGADLSEADLRWANLTGADLSGADLRWANLTEAIGDNFVTFQAGKHYAVFGGGFGYIGCERRTYQEWLDEYEDIGWTNDYTLKEIEHYGALIEIAVDFLTGQDDDD